MASWIEDWSAERVLVTGGRGFLGESVCERVKARGAALLHPSHRELDLLQRADVHETLRQHRPSIVLHLAAEVGGIGANVAHPGRFAYSNLVMGAELFEACRVHHVKALIVASTTCTYPANAPVPLHPRDWWAGYPAAETAPYGLAKKMLFVLGRGYAQEFRMRSSHVILANLYGPGDHVEEERSHVIPALIRRFLEATEQRRSEVVVWGTGKPTREFVHVRDAAEGLLLAAEKDEGEEPLNLGSGEEIEIRSLATLIAKAVGYSGAIRFDATKPDGHMRRCLDSSRARSLGFHPRVMLADGIPETVRWMRKTILGGHS